MKREWKVRNRIREWKHVIGNDNGRKGIGKENGR